MSTIKKITRDGLTGIQWIDSQGKRVELILDKDSNINVFVNELAKSKLLSDEHVENYIQEHLDIKYGEKADLEDGIVPIKQLPSFISQPGPKGDDGYTPVKGVDYFDGSDGYTPIKGIDYFDGEPGAQGPQGEPGETPALSYDGSITNLMALTQAEYDAIIEKDLHTLYFVKQV